MKSCLSDRTRAVSPRARWVSSGHFGDSGDKLAAREIWVAPGNQHQLLETSWGGWLFTCSCGARSKEKNGNLLSEWIRRMYCCRNGWHGWSSASMPQWEAPEVGGPATHNSQARTSSLLWALRHPVTSLSGTSTWLKARRDCSDESFLVRVETSIYPTGY